MKKSKNLNDFNDLDAFKPKPHIHPGAITAIFGRLRQFRQSMPLHCRVFDKQPRTHERPNDHAPGVVEISL